MYLNKFSTTQREKVSAMTTTQCDNFDRTVQMHLTAVKQLYRARCSPRDAHDELRRVYGIHADTEVITRLFHTFRTAGVEKVQIEKVLALLAQECDDNGTNG